MANVKITDLTAYTDAASTDVLPVVDVTNDVTKKISIADLLKAAPLGSAAAPGIAFDGDPNTGVYSPGADQVAISTNGSGRLFVDSSGRVGIATSAPNKLLHIAGTEGVVGAYQLELEGRFSGYGAGITFSSRTSSGGTLLPMAKITADGEAAWDTTAANQDAGLRFYTTLDGTLSEKLRLDASGRLGIGTTSVNAKLEISGNSGGRGLRLSEPSGEELDISAGASANDPARIATSSGSGIAFAVNGTSGENARIDSSGRVGIGTNSVASILHTSGSSDQAVTIQTTTAGADTRINFRNSAGTDAGGIQYLHNGNHLLFNANAGERARIDGSGRLLIGTSSSPSGGQGQYARLVVQGYTGDGTAEGIFAIQRGQGATSILSQGDIGRIIFNDNVGNTFAGIYCFADATPGTNDYPGRLVLSVTADGASSPTESYRIVNNGRLEFKQNYSVRYAQLLDSSSATGTQYFFQFGRNGSECGNITSTGANSTTYATSSDYRLKENLVLMPGAIERLARLKVYRFNFIQEPDRTVDGFVAHEVQAVVPEAIVGEKDAVDDEGNPIYQGIDQSKLVPLLTAALQEAVAKIESLEARLTAAVI